MRNMRKYKDLCGKTFGMLYVIKEVESSRLPSGQFVHNLLCECSCENKNQVVCSSSNLTNGSTRSCGCLKRYNNKKFNLYDICKNIGYFSNTADTFYFDAEDYEKIKEYCWFQNKEGYAATRSILNGKEKIILLADVVMNNLNKEYVVDHINHCRTDCRKRNLRKCLQKDNSKNNSINVNNSSGVSGVSWCKREKKWRAYIGIDNKQKSCGYFVNKEDAIKARLRAEAKYYGEFAPQHHLFEEYRI